MMSDRITNEPLATSTHQSKSREVKMLRDNQSRVNAMAVLEKAAMVCLISTVQVRESAVVTSKITRPIKSNPLAWRIMRGFVPAQRSSKPAATTTRIGRVSTPGPI